MTQTTTEVRPQTSHGEPGDHERLAHYVDKGDLERAILDGVPARALCGKLWLPTRDPKDFPVCPECKDIYDGMEPGDPEPGE